MSGSQELTLLAAYFQHVLLPICTRQKPTLYSCQNRNVLGGYYNKILKTLYRSQQYSRSFLCNTGTEYIHLNQWYNPPGFNWVRHESANLSDKSKWRGNKSNWIAANTVGICGIFLAEQPNADHVNDHPKPTYVNESLLIDADIYKTSECYKGHLYVIENLYLHYLHYIMVGR